MVFQMFIVSVDSECRSLAETVITVNLSFVGAKAVHTYLVFGEVAANDAFFHYAIDDTACATAAKE